MGDRGGPVIADWQVAEDIPEWIEIVAIAAITAAVLIAFAVGIGSVRRLGCRNRSSR